MAKNPPTVNILFVNPAVFEKVVQPWRIFLWGSKMLGFPSNLGISDFFLNLGIFIKNLLAV
jgi:hypothetical protein